MRTKKRSNGEGTVYFVEKQQRWRAEITWYDNAGNKRKKSWTSQKQSEVRNNLAEFKKQLLINGTELTTEQRTFQQFSEEWLRVVLKPKLKPTSYERKVVTLENQVYNYIGGIRSDKLTHSHIQQMCFASYR